MAKRTPAATTKKKPRRKKLIQRERDIVNDALNAYWSHECEKQLEFARKHIRAANGEPWEGNWEHLKNFYNQTNPGMLDEHRALEKQLKELREKLLGT